MAPTADSVRSMAKHAGRSKSTVQEIWSSKGIKPYRVEAFKLSNDTRFEEKLTDVVELYLNPPEYPVGAVGDDKSQALTAGRRDLLASRCPDKSPSRPPHHA
jgi:hypothetical protein